MKSALGPDAQIVIFGAGSIGCFIGGLLARAGRRVTFLSRPALADELGTFGLHLTDLAGLNARLLPSQADVRTSPTCLSTAALVLVTVKSRSTQAAANDIAAAAAKDARVVSLQNGIENPAILRESLGQARVLGGMVGFNVVHLGRGLFHRGTSGNVVIEAGRPDVIELLSVPGLRIESATDIASVQWGKLVVNLNNALNALSNLPLRQQLENRAWRRVLADQIAEAVVILDAAGIKTVAATKVPARLIPPLLRLPNALFRIAAGPMLKIDAEARSSMWEDLNRRRPTEVDQFQGAIIALARQHGLKAPLSEKVLRLVNAAETAAKGPPNLSPEQIMATD